jgi:phosphatidate cytidylyltransferase
MNRTENTPKEKRALFDRVWVAIIAVPIVCALIWFGAPWFTLLAVAWSMGGVWEYYNLVKHSRGLSPLTVFGMLWTGLLVASPHMTGLAFLRNIAPAPLILTLGLIISLLILLFRKDKTQAFSNWAWTFSGILYIGWLASFMVAARNLDDGRAWLFLAIGCTFASDSAAYLIGRRLGKHKLAPYVSPNKSWEGAIAGVAGAVILSPLAVYLLDLPVQYWQVLILAAVISVAGQLGDLVKSLFKRNMEVKDSGHILPGHGGFLDRMDSLLFAGTVVYFCAVYLAG